MTLETVQTWLEGGVDITRRRALRSDGLFHKGKMFAFMSGANLVLKLPADRAAFLVQSGVGTVFLRGGRPMKSWICLPFSDEENLRSLCRIAASDR